MREQYFLSEATTETPSPFAQNMLFGFVGSVMYQYDVPQAERSTQLLSMDLEVLERLLGSTDMASLLDAEAITQVRASLLGEHSGMISLKKISAGA